MAMVEYLDMVLLVTVVILAMVVSMVVTMENVKLTVSLRLTLTPTPSDKSPMDYLRLMHMLLVTPTMLE